MNTAAIYIRTDPKVKAQAQKVSHELGLSLSSLINAWLKQLIKTKTVTFSALDKKYNGHHKGTGKEGKTSPAFDNIKDTIAYLEKLGL